MTSKTLESSIIAVIILVAAIMLFNTLSQGINRVFSQAVEQVNSVGR
jgi:Flp pilus assembly pilin Flp